MRIPAHKAGNVAKMFDFQCTKCDHTFESLWRNGDIVTCPKCNEPANKTLSAPRVDSHAAANWRR